MKWIVLAGALVITSSAQAQQGAFTQQTVAVTDFGGDKAVRFDAETGDPLDHIVGTRLGGLDGSRGMTIGPDGNLYIVAGTSHEVVRYDAITGEFIDVFVSTHLDVPIDVAFGPDGNLYVSNCRSDNVQRFDGEFGFFIDTFVSGAGLDCAASIAFGPDGDLYVSSFESSQVLRFDGKTGNFIDVVIQSGQLGLAFPLEVVFNSAGDLFVANAAADSVLRWESASDTVSFAVTPGSGGLNEPQSLAFSPDESELWVTGKFGPNSVIRYDAGGPQDEPFPFIDVPVVSGEGGLSPTPSHVIFLPRPCPGDFSGDGTLDSLDFFLFLDQFVAGCPD